MLQSTAAMDRDGCELHLCDAVDEHRHSVYLAPGNIAVSSEPCVVTTILGSCVAVCLTDPQVRIGGVNHFLLPYRDGDERSLRFGDIATRALVERLVALGCRRMRLRAKLFGGACLVADAAPRSGRLGALNVRIAYEVLREMAIPVVAEDIEGKRGRKLHYHTHDGTAWVRQL